MIAAFFIDRLRRLWEAGNGNIHDATCVVTVGHASGFAGNVDHPRRGSGSYPDSRQVTLHIAHMGHSSDRLSRPMERSKSSRRTCRVQSVTNRA